MIEAIDLTKLMPAGLKAFPQAVMAVIPAMADITRNEIIRLAGERLTSSSQLYAAAVQVPKFHFPSGKIPDGLQTVASITLIDWLPNAIEKGWSGMDLKPALLDGRNAKDMKGGGRYNIVPFRHGSPGTSGRNFGRENGRRHRRGHGRLDPCEGEEAHGYDWLSRQGQRDLRREAGSHASAPPEAASQDRPALRHDPQDEARQDGRLHDLSHRFIQQRHGSLCPSRHRGCSPVPRRS